MSACSSVSHAFIMSTGIISERCDMLRDVNCHFLQPLETIAEGALANDRVC